MSIKSTVTITRSAAIQRIDRICSLAADQDYQAVENACFEPDYSVQEFVDSCGVVYPAKWSNQMLGNFMDKPFFRFSMFENYFVQDDES